MAKVKMPHAGHGKHLCYLHNLGFHLSEPEEYRALVKNSKYVCNNCGRAAAKAENLCKPVKL